MPVGGAWAPAKAAKREPPVVSWSLHLVNGGRPFETVARILLVFSITASDAHAPISRGPLVSSRSRPCIASGNGTALFLRVPLHPGFVGELRQTNPRPHRPF